MHEERGTVGAAIFRKSVKKGSCARAGSGKSSVHVGARKPVDAQDVTDARCKVQRVSLRKRLAPLLQRAALLHLAGVQQHPHLLCCQARSAGALTNQGFQVKVYNACSLCWGSALGGLDGDHLAGLHIERVEVCQQLRAR